MKARPGAPSGSGGTVPEDRVFARSTFDGNFTAAPSFLILPEPAFEGITVRALAILTEMMYQGDLSWIVVVPPGYRL